MKTAQSITLADIAYRAGVTKTTVSRALSPGRGRSMVSAEVRARIQALAADLKYRPNIGAKGLQRRRSFLIGVLYAEGNSPYVVGMSRGVQRVLAQNGLAPVVYMHSNNEEELAFVDQCVERGVEGILVNVSVDAVAGTNVRAFERLRESGLPMVEINGRLIDGVPHVFADYEAAARMLTKRLVEAGRRRIVLYMSGLYAKHPHQPGFAWNARDFLRGYEDTMRQAGLKSEIIESSIDDADPSKMEPPGLTDLARQSATIPSAVVCPGPTTADRISRFIMGSPQADNIRVAAFGKFRGVSLLSADAIRLEFPDVLIGETAVTLLLKQLEKPSQEEIALAPEFPPGT